jgi:hypothetical protein
VVLVFVRIEVSSEPPRSSEVPLPFEVLMLSWRKLVPLQVPGPLVEVALQTLVGMIATFEMAAEKLPGDCAKALGAPKARATSATRSIASLFILVSIEIVNQPAWCIFERGVVVMA